jgi:LPS-assembly protein
VIDQSTDAILTPIVSSGEGLAGDVKLRHSFNFGQINVNASAGFDKGQLQGALFADGTFDLDSAWRAGFNIARASSVTYLNDYSILPNTNELESQLYLEGFGQGSYARIESSFYQGLVDSVTNSELPLVLPYAAYAYKGDPDSLGGTIAVNAARRSAATITCPSRTASASNGGRRSISTWPATMPITSTNFPITTRRTRMRPSCAPCRNSRSTTAIRS